MELSFQSAQLSYLKRLFHKVQYQEETAEAVVPDSLPDILSIIDCYAEPFIREKQCSNGVVSISGSMKGGIIYQPDDNSHARTLDFYLPFTVKLENSALTEHSQVICSVQIRAVDSCAINSRKAILRVTLGCFTIAFEPAAETLSSISEAPPELQTRQAVYNILLPLETAEKAFSINDSQTLPSEFPPIAHICNMRCNTTVREQKIVGDKAVFKGTVECTLFYLSNCASYHTYKFSLPFSQFCELQTAYDQESLELYPVLTGCNWETEAQDAAERFDLSIHLLMQCIVSGAKELRVTEDAYYLHGTLSPEWASCTLDTCLDRQHYHQSLHKSIGQPYQQIVDSAIYLGFPVCETEQSTAKVTTAAQIHLLGYNEEGLLTAAVNKIEDTKLLACADQCEVVSQAALFTAPDLHMMTDGLEISCDLSVASSFYTAQTLTSLVGGSIEAERDTQRQPSLILRKNDPDVSLWQIAKQYGTSVSAIQDANEWAAEGPQASQFILIPLV